MSTLNNLYDYLAKIFLSLNRICDWNNLVMKIIIAGAGDVGFHLAKLLSYEQQDITLIDTDQEKLKYVSSHIDVATLRGSSTSYKILEEAKVAKADLLLAVTSSEEVNLATAVIGKTLGAKRTVARIKNMEFIENKDKLDFRKIGIDALISPESLAAEEIKKLLKAAALTNTIEFDGGLLNLIGISIDNGHPFLGKTLSETAVINASKNFVCAAILKNGETLIPKGNIVFELGDHAYFIVTPQGEEQIIAYTGHQNRQIKNIMIVGGSSIGVNAARMLSKKYNVKLIEIDKDKCFEIADQLPDTLVINGDCSDVELLKEEGISDMDAFIAVTGNTETNIIASLVAKNHGVGKTISLVENIDYIRLSQNIGVDTMINKKLIAANFIFRFVRVGKVVSVSTIHGVDAEVLEFEITNNCKITKKKIAAINFPEEAVIGGVIREGKGYTPNGDFQIREKDRVVVLCKLEAIHQVESFFH